MNYEGEAATIGELWVTYRIYLETPQLEPDITPQIQFLKAVADDSYYTPFKDMSITDLEENIGVSLVDGNTFQFTQPGIYTVLHRLSENLQQVGVFDSDELIDPTITQSYVDPSQTSELFVEKNDVSTDDTSVDPANDCVLHCYVKAANTTTKDNPLEFAWAGIPIDPLVTITDNKYQLLDVMKVNDAPYFPYMHSDISRVRKYSANEREFVPRVKPTVAKVTTLEEPCRCRH